MSPTGEAVKVIVLVQPSQNLPLKEWQVEIKLDKKLKDLEKLISSEYQCPPDIIKICGSHSWGATGFDDNAKIGDIAKNHEGGQGAKKVYLQAEKGMEEEFLDCVLDWAFRAEILEEYEAQGCVHRRLTQEDRDEMAKKARAGEAHGRGNSIIGRQERAMSFLSTASRGPSNMISMLKNRRANVPRGEFKVLAGGKMEMLPVPVKLIDQMPFNAACSIICILNMFVVGLEADYTCWSTDKTCVPGDRMTWYAMDLIFTVLFVVEVAARVITTGPLDYFLGDPLVNLSGIHLPNCADFTIVFARLLDTLVFEQMGMDTKIKVISCLRILQIANVARLMRLVRSVRELWLVIAGLTQLCKTVLWVMILLILIFWVVGIMMTIIVGHSEETFDYSRTHWGKSAYFDTVPKSMYSLFEAMTLAKWSSVMFRPVMETYPGIFLVLIPFLCITTIGLLNIIVGVVVENTLSSASDNREKENKEMVKMHAKVMDSLKMVFDEADTDGGGSIDREELRKMLKKKHVRDRLRLLDIPVADLDQLFTVLDEEGLGEIKTDQFFRGCSRLRGLALSCDLHRMSIDFNRYNGWTDNLVEKIQTQNHKLAHLLYDMEGVDRDIIRGDADDCDPVLQARRHRGAEKAKKTAKEFAEEESAKRGGSKITTASKASLGSRRSSRKGSLMAATLRSGMSELGLKPHDEEGDSHHDNSRHGTTITPSGKKVTIN